MKDRRGVELLAIVGTTYYSGLSSFLEKKNELRFRRPTVMVHRFRN